MPVLHSQMITSNAYIGINKYAFRLRFLSGSYINASKAQHQIFEYFSLSLSLSLSL